MELILLDKEVSCAKKVVIFNDDAKEEASEVVLGRGPLLQLADVKLSRAVARIKRLKKGQFILDKVGKKAVFHAKKESDQMKEMTEEVEVHDGDIVGLTQERYIFRVKILDSKVNGEAEKVDGHSKSKEEDKDTVSINKVSKRTLESVEEKENICENKALVNGNGSAIKGEKEKRPNGAMTASRKLPAWMMKAASTTETATEKDEPPVKRRKDDKAPIKRSKKQETPSPSPSKASPSSPKAEGTSLPVREKTPSPKMERTSSPARTPKRSPSPARTPKRSASPVRTPKRSPASSSPWKRSPASARAHTISDDDDEEDVESEKATIKKTPEKTKGESFKATKRRAMSPSSGEEEEDPEPPKFAKKTPKKTQNKVFPVLISKDDMKDSEEEDEEDEEEEEAKLRADLKATAAKRVPPRPSCNYGATCYRKNPKHKDEEAHPGDDDYQDPNVRNSSNYIIN